ncbi:hypothetical protein P691DRAFT_775400 [Macrolepiota fuliginosa MF-IS2]|uniref:Velvet domain-containing protein n=1 Tax=Macrolepiota fuliginosa MF-IS2 TaxID=1400762 RepID=A0A9P5XE40_9AGAR|nr:hypothetical protein P691DRAFT_775400 [Macrolepiota fuliginosa MF-IS2]
MRLIKSSYRPTFENVDSAQFPSSQIMMYAPTYYNAQSLPSSRGPQQPQSPQDPSAGAGGATADPVLINRRIYFSSGQFAGQRIRFELKEIQKASLGRKYARVDRRPLDPPPVVLARIFRTCPETENEEEINYEDVQTHGLLCTVDLFPVPAKTSKDSPPSITTSHPRTSKTIQTNDGFVHFNPSGPTSIPSLTSSPPYRPQAYGPSDIVHYYDGIYPLLESSKTTHSLVGATFVQPVLVEITGQKCVVFVFSDLAVKTEGTFTLRYRIFDLFSQNQDPRGASQSPPPPTTYPATPDSSSISPTLSNAAPPTPSPVSGSDSAPPTSSTIYSASVSRLRSPQPHPYPPQSQPYSQAQSQPMNPYPDPSQGYIAPAPVPQQPRRRAQELEEISPDFQAQFAPYDSHPRIEPDNRNTSLSILAECWAKGAFRIYSTKEFPGLPASTDLTKHLARWGVRLNIRETERRRRRRSMMEDEEYHSDAVPGDGSEGSGSAKDQQLFPQRKTTAIKPKPQTPTQILPQMSPVRSPSRSPPQSVQQRRASTSTWKPFGKQHQSRSSFDEDEEYEGEPEERRGSVSSPVGLDTSGSVYGPNSKQPRSPPAPTSGIPAYHAFTYQPAPASNGFDPSNPGFANAHTTETSQMGYTTPPQMHTAYSGMRSSIMGVNMFSQQGPPSQMPGFSRPVGSRKRDSDGGSSASGGSAGSAAEMQGIGTPFVFGIGHGTEGARG